MEIVNVSMLEQIYDILSSDQFHLIRQNDYSVLASYRSQAANLGDVFISVSAVNALKDRLDATMNELATLSNSMLMRTEGDGLYMKTETIDAKTPALVTNSSLATTLSKYPKQETLNAKQQELYAEARRLADEMTDFTGAAMVGINQSNATYQPSEETEEKKE